MGVKTATAPYVCFVDSDDFMSFIYFEAGLKRALETKADAVINDWAFNTEKTKYVCLNDSTSIEGHKYLFSGCINEKMVYRTIYIDYYGGKKMWELNVNNCSVFEDNKNKVVAYKKEYSNPTVIKLIGSYGEIFKEDNISRYEIHIPQGSITTEYNVDLN